MIFGLLCHCAITMGVPKLAHEWNKEISFSESNGHTFEVHYYYYYYYYYYSLSLSL